MQRQETIHIGEVSIPVIYEDGVRWFSLKRLCENVLLRSSICSKKDLKHKYKHHIRFLDIKYSKNQPVKSTTCISEIGLIEILVKTNVSNLTLEDIKNQNILHTYLGIIPIIINDKEHKKIKKQKNNPIKWSKNKIKQQLNNRHRKGLTMSSSAVQGENRNLHEAAIKHFGSWQCAINETLNIDYDEIREDVDTMQYYGIKFEELLGEIINEVDGEYVKGYNQFLRPDFVLQNQWIDAKLSFWTNSIPETIEKYEPFCSTLRILYLRGNRKYDKMETKKTRMTSVYVYISRLPEERQMYYQEMLDDLYYKANEQERLLKIKEAI